MNIPGADMTTRHRTKLAMPQVVTINRLFYQQKYPDHFHSDASNEILHIIEGHMVLRLQSGKEYSAGKNDTLFIPHGVLHKDIFDIQGGLEVFHINFKW